jgi:hypothetical protein
VFRKGVEHVVEEADAGPYPDLLRRGCLRGVGLSTLGWDGEGGAGEMRRVGEWREWAAVEGEGELDFCFFGVAGEGSGAGGEGGHCGGGGLVENLGYNIGVIGYVRSADLDLVSRIGISALGVS